MPWYTLVIILVSCMAGAIYGILQSRKEQKQLIEEIRQKQKLADRLNALGTHHTVTFSAPLSDVRPGDGLWLRPAGEPPTYLVITKVPSPSTVQVSKPTWWRLLYWSIRRALRQTWSWLFRS